MYRHDVFYETSSNLGRAISKGISRDISWDKSEAVIRQIGSASIQLTASEEKNIAWPYQELYLGREYNIEPQLNLWDTAKTHLAIILDLRPRCSTSRQCKYLFCIWGF